MQTYDLVAITPQQMERSHASLVDWADAGIADAKAKAREAKSAYEQAVERKWKSSYLKSVWKREEKRVHFFVKTKKAIEAGFYIIPDFWIDTFALRVPEGMKASRSTHISRWSAHDPPLKPRALPEGEGEYVDPQPYYATWKEREEIEGGSKVSYYGSRMSEIDREIGFPAVMAKPAIMSRAEAAMALKVFDEMGIIQQQKDPIIAGRIRHPKGRHLLFFIAWDFDPEGF